MTAMKSDPVNSFFLIFALLLLLTTVEAADFRSGETIVISEEVTDDLYVGGGSITIEDNIDGDLIGGGGEIKIKGNVADDVIIGGGTIIVDGEIGDDLRAGGGAISINSKVNGDLLLGGGNIQINNDIGGDAVIAGGNILITGNIGRNLRIDGGKTVISGVIGGNATITSNTIELLPGAEIKGNLIYTSKEKAKIHEGAVIHGKTSHMLPKEPVRKERSHLNRTIFSFLGLFIIGALLVYFSPNASLKVADKIYTSPGKSILLGFAGLILIPVSAIILLFTLIGIPLALLGILLYVIAIYVSSIFVGIVIGRETLKALNKKKYSLVWALLIGLVILTALKSLPFIGAGVSMLTILLGIGGILLAITEKKKVRKSRKKK